ncbi:MAG: hypothetical protein JO187_05055 [Acidobacteria bacterium]|nr:hypothetical protein [Acidobacteriota bacterium]
MNIKDNLTRRTGRIVLSLLAGMVIFLVSVGLDHLLVRFTSWKHRGELDDLFMGLVCGALIFFYEEQRHRAMLRRFSSVGEINHIIRNELEIIQYSAHFTQNKEHIERIRSCVGHIDSALRDVLGEKKPPRSQTGTETDRPRQSQARLG